MTTFNRRSLLKASAGALLAPAAVSAAEPSKFPQRYGVLSSRTFFRSCWRDLPAHPFLHEDHATFHRLRTRFDALYSRCEQPVTLAEDTPVRVSVKLLCQAEVGRPLFTLGVKTETHGCWAFTIGSSPTPSATGQTTGWEIIVNAANPMVERQSLAGFDNHDWHTFVLTVPHSRGPARLYCDGQYVMDLRQPITDSQRERVPEEQKNRHGSTRHPIPGTGGEGTYLFIESRHPGQQIDIDAIQVSQEPLTTSRASLWVLRDLDWELEGTRIVENTLTRFQGNPVLKTTDVPDPSGTNRGPTHAYVLKDEAGFHMYFCGAYRMNKVFGRFVPGIYRAWSPDGVRWEVTPKHPVLKPGELDEWDGGALGQLCVRKERGVFRMWYGGYVANIAQGRAGYAESRDGIHWTKPVLGHFPFAGKETNICYPLQPGLSSNEYELPVSIIRDEDAPPERCYLLFLHTQGPRAFIVDVATSQDGYRFVRAPHNARHYAFDEVPRSSTLHTAAIVLHEPNYWWAFVGHHELERAQYRMRFTAWVVEPEEKENIGFGLWRSSRLHLEPDPDSWEGTRAPITSALEVGSEWWVYYCGAGGVGLAKVGRHRMYGLQVEPNRQSGLVTSVGFNPPENGWPAYELVVNTSGFAGRGQIAAELLDALSGKTLAGFELEDCAPVTKDGFDVPLRWRSANGRLPATKKPLRVRLRLTRGSGNLQLHGLYFRPNHSI